MSTSASQAKLGELIELHFENDGGRVRVVPSDNSLLLLSVEEAIAACRASKRQIEFNSQFDLLLKRIARWLELHRRKVLQSFLTLRDAGLLLLVVTKATAYDEELEAEITKLDVEIANDADYHLVDLSILAIPASPEESVNSFLSNKMKLRFVFDGDRE